MNRLVKNLLIGVGVAGTTYAVAERFTIPEPTSRDPYVAIAHNMIEKELEVVQIFVTVAAGLGAMGTAEVVRKNMSLSSVNDN